MEKVTADQLHAKVERVGQIIEKMKTTGTRTPVNLTIALSMLTAPDAPPPTRDELHCVKTLIEQEIALLTKMNELIERLLNEQ